MKKNRGHSKPSTDVILRQAIEDNDIAQVKFVLRFERDKINDQDENQMTALHWSCMYGRLEIVGVLLDHGAGLEMRDSKGWTALHFAANGGYLDVVEMLIASCADVAATSYDGKVAIDVARGEGMVFLLATGFIKAGKEELLLRYFGDSTTSLRSIEENEDEESLNSESMSQSIVSREIWRASQQLLTKDFPLNINSISSLKISTSEYGICCKNGAKSAKDRQEGFQKKRSTPMVPQYQQVQFLSLPRKQRLNNFDSSFSPGVLKRLAVSETNLNLNSAQGMDCNNNDNSNVCADMNGTPHFYGLDAVDSDAFIAAAESRI